LRRRVDLLNTPEEGGGSALAMKRKKTTKKMTRKPAKKTARKTTRKKATRRTR
jgi:hypothetical protein